MDLNKFMDQNYKMNPNYSANQNNQISFRCTYKVEDINKNIRLVNDRLNYMENQEISTKIRILNNNKKENLIFLKRFDNPGIHIIDYTIEGTIYNMSFLFSECSSLKQSKNENKSISDYQPLHDAVRRQGKCAVDGR